MTGTFINVAAIIVGSLIGLCIKKGINKNLEKSINLSLGLAIIIIGINGIIANMFSVQDGKLASSGELVLVVFLVVGTIIGEWLRIDHHVNNFGYKLETKFKLSGFSQGFVSASVLFCIGAMAIVGSLNDGILGDSTVLIIKSSLDFVASIVLASSLGIGVLFSFIPILIYQGGISLLANSLQGILQGDVLIQVCAVGYAIILAIGLNFVFDKKFKTANLLPCLFMPLVYKFILFVYNCVVNTFFYK